jgi:3-dehydroquinate synthetase
MGEVIKYGAIADAKLFAAVAKGRPRSMAKVIKRCVEIKAKLAGEDERDMKGRRALLNFGHTVAHGLEGVSAYAGLRHGEAVAIGMVVAAHLSVKTRGLKENCGEVEGGDCGVWFTCDPSRSDLGKTFSGDGAR